MNNLYAKDDDIIIGNGKLPLPEGWRWVRCHDIIDIRDGTHDTPRYIPHGVPLVTSKNLRPGGIDFADAMFISHEDHKQIKKRSGVDKGDILFAMIGTIGNPVIVETDREFSIKMLPFSSLQNLQSRLYTSTFFCNPHSFLHN